MTKKRPSALIAIVGPTGVGKTGLAVTLGRELEGEIVSADSRQVYRHIEIGTAKPTREQRRLVPHHLIDVVSPDQEFTLARFQDMAYSAIEDILSRRKVPFLVGGTGLYVRAILEGFFIPRVQPNPPLRRDLQQQVETNGAESLHSRLQEVDPEAAKTIDPRNVRRVIRALEVYQEMKEPISRLRGKEPPPYRTLKVGLTRDREELYRSLDQRVDVMVERGLLAEVQELVDEGYGFDLPAMSGLGYRQMGMYMRGEMDLPTAVDRIKSETHRFVRQQYKWFRLDDETIHWFDVGEEPYEQIKDLILGFLH